MDLGLAQRLARKLTYGEPFTFAEVLLLETDIETGNAFKEILHLQAPVGELPAKFVQRYYVEFVHSTYRRRAFFESFCLFCKLQDPEMAETMLNKAVSLKLNPNWYWWLKAFTPYAPAATLVLLLTKIKSSADAPSFEQSLGDVTKFLIKNDFARFEELVKLLPLSVYNWGYIVFRKTTEGDLNTVRVILSKEGILIHPERVLMEAIDLKSGFDIFYFDQVRQMLEDLGYRIDYKSLVEYAIDMSDRIVRRFIFDEIIRYSVARDPQARQNESAYLAYIQKNYKYGPALTRHLTELIQTSMEQFHPL